MQGVDEMNWKLGSLINSEFKKHQNPKTRAEVEAICELKATAVPGCLELDMIKEGKLPKEIYKGENVVEIQKLEAHHRWYCTEFTFEKRDREEAYLLFEGIDTVAEIFIDGKLFSFTDNMLIPHEFSLEALEEGTHELVVHIIPPVIYARQFDHPAATRAQRYNADSLMIRKAAYMFGWDIMPRIVSGGLWRDVKIVYKKRERIDRCNFLMGKLKGDKASFAFSVRLQSDLDLLTDYLLRIEGSCGDSAFKKDHLVFSIHERVAFSLENPKLWWPKNYGDPNLYDVKVTLLRKNGEIVDEMDLKIGIRTTELDRTDYAGEDGKFCFIINGKPVYCHGTNWVPTSPFPSEHHLYTKRALDMIDDLGCNMIRLWGGNIYPEDALYEYCDEKGIMLWQDFGMGCGYYPWEQKLQDDLRKETSYIVRHLGNHPSIVLWAGDNECDQWFNYPDENILTRKVLKEVVLQEDGTRPYLPSSPYLTKKELGRKPSEDHLWGYRESIKDDYHRGAVSHFVSETGAHGCPSPESIRKFIDADRLTAWGDEKFCADPQWQIHATSPAADALSPYVYRIPVMLRQICYLFGDEKVEDLETYALFSQIFQAEGNKFYIERFRTKKWYCSGMLWWNMIDGWPQFSDAVVDWYGCKKVAYHYIKRSQEAFTMICDEPDEDGNLTLVACNDARETAKVSYRVKNALTGEQILEGSATVDPDSVLRLDLIPEEKVYYLIEWEGNFKGQNHYVGKLGEKIKSEEYIQFMKIAGFYEKLEGFGK